MAQLQATCKQFGIYNVREHHPLGNGLINHSYQVKADDGQLYFLQQINTTIFKKPVAFQTNYEQIKNYLSSRKVMALPKLIKTLQGELM